MNVLMLVVTLIISLVVQNSVLPYITVFGVMGNILLTMVVSISLLERKPYGSVVGLIVGLIQDILFSQIIGINALLYFLLGYVLESIDFHLSRDNLYIPATFSMGATVVYNLVYFIVMFFAGKEISFLNYIKYKLLIELAYNGLLSIISYKLMSKIFVAPDIRFYRE